MTQQRIYDFGALLTQGRANALSSGLFSPGIYSGFEPTVINATTIEFSAGTYLLPNGVLISETGTTQVTVPTPGPATDYTITVDHDNIQALGGSAAYYTLRTGLTERSSDPNAASVALLWIRHEGSTPLTSAMLSRPPRLRASDLLGSVENGFVPAPFADKADVVAGSNITAVQKSRTIQTGSATATLAAAGAGSIVVTGLVGMTTSSIGRYLRLTGAANPLNNGLFRITAYTSATSVTISDNGVAPGAGTASWKEDEPHNLGLQIVNSAVLGLQTYTFRLPLPPRPLPRSIEIYAAIPALGSISLSTGPYESLDADRNVLDLSPSFVNGAVDAADPRSAPAATLVLGNYDESAPPSSLGVTVTVPAQTPGVFLKGFRLIGD